MIGDLIRDKNIGGGADWVMCETVLQGTLTRTLADMDLVCAAVCACGCM